jgi:hypothetical protein
MRASVRMLGSVRADGSVSTQTYVRVRADAGVRARGRPMSARTLVASARTAMFYPWYFQNGRYSASKSRTPLWLSSVRPSVIVCMTTLWWGLSSCGFWAYSFTSLSTVLSIVFRHIMLLKIINARHLLSLKRFLCFEVKSRRMLISASG